MSTDAMKDFGSSIAHHLGSPRDVAATAAKEYRKAHFCRRHPILSFVVMPIVALPMMWALSVFAFLSLVGLAAYLSGDELSPDLAWAGPFVPLIVCAMVLVPVGLAAAFFCGLARKAQSSWKWPLATCFILAILSGLAVVDVAIRGSHTRGMIHGTRYRNDVPLEAGKTGYLSFGFGMNAHPSLAQIAQFALPLSIGAWALCRQANQRRSACLG